MLLTTSLRQTRLVRRAPTAIRQIISASMPRVAASVLWLYRAAVPMLLGGIILIVGQAMGSSLGYKDGYIEGCSVFAYGPLCTDAQRLSELVPRAARIVDPKSAPVMYRDIFEETSDICHRVMLLTGGGTDLSRTASRIATRYQCPTTKAER